MKLRPFDLSMIEDTSMYDHLPYQRDADICNIGSVALCSGNLLKHYRCAFGDTLELTDMDKLAVEKIQEYIEREQERLGLSGEEPEVVDSYEDDYNDELSEEQIASLLSEKPNTKRFLGNYDEEDF